MTFRRLPPVYSPLDLRALAMGLAAIVTGGSGPRHRLEQWLATRYGASRVLLTDSGTTALTLAIRAAVGSKGPRRVALPAYACYDLATAADGADVEVVLYDLDPNTLGPDWDSFTRAVSAGVGAVVLVHLYGIPVDVGRAMDIADSHGVAVIEDAAQGVGGSFDGRPLGSFGEYSVLSFGRGKGFSGGGGGALLVRGTDALASDAAREGGGLGHSRGAAPWLKALAQWILSRPALYALPAGLPFLALGETIYRRPEAAAGLSASAGGILHSAVRFVEPEADRRRANAREIQGSFSMPAGVRGFEAPPRAVPGFLRLPVLVEGAGVARWRGKPAKRLGIARGYPLALSDLRGFTGRIVQSDAPLAGALRLAAGLHTIPVHSQLSRADIARLLSWLGSETPAGQNASSGTSS